MRCFTACFRTNCNHKRIIIKKPCTTNKINSISPKALQDLLETHENGESFVAIDDTKEESQHEVAIPINLIEESKDKEEEELNSSSKKKVVTFDLNVSMYDEILLANQVSANYSEINSQKENGKEEANMLSDLSSNLQKQNRKEEEANELSNSSVSSYISYPPSYRYHCCINSVDEFEDIDLEDDANNNNNENDDVEIAAENGLMIQEESSYESLFSLSIDSRKANPTQEMCDKEEVNSPFKQSIKFSAKDPVSKLSVLNPIQWKGDDITMVASQLKKKHQEEKENVDMNLLDFSISYNRVEKEPKLKSQESEIAVDTSLSSWLVKSSQDDNNNITNVVPQVGSVESSQDDTSNSKSSPASVGNSPLERTIRFDDRPILIGTVGSYLRHTGQATAVFPKSAGISSL
ncbi:hypothetical protein K7X08_027031 [Anisodus acutangulus]|uniref:Uncharacterized protein n=1 Tax=Anisodus acutangulus TaxID=402998 RepID=A0A9Q1QZR0_9SOLA|nr:hypothetical protein K7X08_027031 [Anisodus acutangulus]